MSAGKFVGEGSFSWALALLKEGEKVARRGWNGKGMWLVLQPTTPSVEMREGSVYRKAGLKEVQIDGHIDVYTAQGTMQPGWLASQADLLATDWEVVK